MKTLLTISAAIAHMLLAIAIGGLIAVAMMPEHTVFRQVLGALCGV